jgi:F5/8 type C domain/Alpha-L-fucosidase
MKVINTHLRLTAWTGRILIFCMVLIFSLTGSGKIGAAKHTADWLYRAKWGVMTSYLPETNLSAQDWNQRVNNFDVKGLARQLQAVGAKYYIFTIGQNTGHYCAPNAKYDALTKISPSKCSTRDLIADIYQAIHPLGIKLMVYLPSGSPFKDSVAVSRLGGIGVPTFQAKWDAVIREWSLRWGKKVEGWWFDGIVPTYYSNAQPPNFSSFVAAAKAGNPNSIVAFNPGPKYPPTLITSQEDYTAGEVYDLREMYCDGRWIQKKSQFHLTSFLGSDWGVGGKRYSNQQVQDITRRVNKCGGVITWDVPPQINGRMPQPFVEQLMTLKNAGSSERSRAPKPTGNLASFKPTRILNLAGERDLPVNASKHFPGQGVDGDLMTFAQASDEWPWTFQVDLAKVYPVKKIVINFGVSYATEYRVISSIDEFNWSEIDYEKKGQGGRRVYKLAANKMRYIRVQGLKPNGPDQKGLQMTIAELEAYQ